MRTYNRKSKKVKKRQKDKKEKKDKKEILSKPTKNGKLTDVVYLINVPISIAPVHRRVN